MIKYNPRAEIILQSGNTFECGNDSYVIGGGRNIIGPKIIKRSGEKIQYSHFFGGLPEGMTYEEAKKRASKTLELLSNERNDRILFNATDVMIWKAIWDDSPSIIPSDKAQEKSKRQLEYAMTCPNGDGIFEALQRPAVGGHLVFGLSIGSEDKTNPDYPMHRIVVSRNPVTRAYRTE